MTYRTITWWGCVLVVGWFCPAEARISVEEGRVSAHAAVEALGGDGASLLPAREVDAGVAFEGDDRWSVFVDWDTGDVRSLWDFSVVEPDHEHPDAAAPPEDEAVEARGREILLQACPGTDFTDFRLDRVLRWGGQWMNPLWRQEIPENGFPGGAFYSVAFCWLDGTVRDLAAHARPIPDAWRRPATITEEQAVEIGKKAVTFREDLPVVYVAEKAFEGYGDNLPAQPVWQVMAYDGVPEDQAMRVVFGGCLVDPWTGEVLAIPDYEAAGGAPSEAGAMAEVPEARPDSPLRTVIGCVMLALGLVGAVVLLRSRRASG